MDKLKLYLHNRKLKFATASENKMSKERKKIGIHNCSCLTDTSVPMCYMAYMPWPETNILGIKQTCSNHNKKCRARTVKLTI